MTAFLRLGYNLYCAPDDSNKVAPDNRKTSAAGRDSRKVSVKGKR